MEASEHINELADTWFVPIKKDLTLDGNASRMILLPSPIIELDSTEPDVDDDYTTHEYLTPKVAAYEPYVSLGMPNEIPRSVARPVGGGTLVYQPGDFYLRCTNRFPEGIGNISVSGYFGYLAEPVTKYSTTLKEEFSNGDTTVVLNDTSGFIKDKIAIFLNADSEQVYTAVVTGTTGSTGDTITIDAADDLDVTLPIDSTVITFGKVPLPIKRATLIMAIELKSSLSDMLNDISGRVLEEKTDNYQYKLGKGDGISSSIGGGGGYLTSISKLICNYIKPGFIGFA
jgi:hypothetical protein